MATPFEHLRTVQGKAPSASTSDPLDQALRLIAAHRTKTPVTKVVVGRDGNINEGDRP